MRWSNIEGVDYHASHMDEAWTLLYDLVMTERARLPQIAAEFDVSPAQVHALRVLEPGTEVPMGRLARALGCDASNVTGIVDRLERRGLVERRARKQDRRVRVLVITGRGARLRERIMVRISYSEIESTSTRVAHLSSIR